MTIDMDQDRSSPVGQTSLGGSPRALTHRQKVMRLCALANSAELAAAVAEFRPAPDVTVVRGPETGLVMIEGRIGGDGARFNVGETTVTRAVVALSTGETGFAYLIGRRSHDAHLAAIIDAAAQRSEWCNLVDAAFVGPVERRLAAERAERSAETEATRVDFFTLERGENPA